MRQIILTSSLFIFLSWVLTTCDGQSVNYEIPFQELSSSGISFGAVLSSSTINVTLSGSNGALSYFGVGFGTTMTNADAIIYTTGLSGTETMTLYDYRLTAIGISGVQKDNLQDWNVINDSVSGNMRTVNAWRFLNTNDSNDVVFTYPPSSPLNLIWALSTTGFRLVYHASRGNGITIPFVTNSLSPSTSSSRSPTSTSTSNSRLSTSAPTSSNIGIRCAPGVRLSVNNQLLSNSGITLSISYDCNATRLELFMIGPDSRWFGILFGDSMVPSDSVIYTTGISGSDPARLYDYHLSSRTNSGVNRDIDDWEEISLIRRNGNVELRYQRPLTTNDTIRDRQFDENNLVFNVMWARGATNSMQLSNHMPQNRANQILQFNLHQGTVSVRNRGILTSNIVHGSLMFASWGVFAPFGIFASRNRHLIGDPLWFYIHRASLTLSVLSSISGLIQAIIMVEESQSGHFNNLHDILGLCIIILSLFQPLNAFFRPKKDKKNRKQWEYTHKSCGYILLIAAQFEILFGIRLLNVPVVFIIYIVYIAIVILLFLGATMYQCKFKVNKEVEPGVNITQL